MTDRASINSLTSDQLDALHRRAEQAEAVAAETKRLLERRTTTLRERAERAEADRDAALAAMGRLSTLCDTLDATQPAGVPHPVAAYIREYIGEHALALATSHKTRPDAVVTLTDCQPAAAADVAAGAAEQQDIETAVRDAVDRP